MISEVFNMMKDYAVMRAELKEKLPVITGGNFAVGPFIPCRVNGRCCERVFLYGGAAGTQKSRPYLSVLLSSDNGLLLEYKNAYAGDFADTRKYPLGAPMDYGVPTAATAAEQGELIRKLDELYAQVRQFAFAETIDETQKKALAAYAGCLRDTVPAALLAFCRDAEPDFFRWLDQTV